jgi:glycosyltransferase involved in cell wall biosynthesis
VSRPRILITSWQDFGAGSIQSVQNLAEGLFERGHDVRVATPADGVLGRRLQNGGIPLVDFAFGRGWHPPTARKLADLIARERIDLVDAQESRDRKAAILARWVYRAGPKLLISRRQLSSTALPQSWLYGVAADVVVGNSYGVARSIRGVPAERICVVQSGHNPRRIAEEPRPGEVEELRCSLGLDPALPTLGTVARRKDQGTLLRVLARMGRPVNVVFVGIERDAELERLEAGIAEGSRVQYTGFVKRPRPFYHLLDLKVLPSHNEGLPQALFEAMALGVPVVSSIIGGTPEMIRDGVNGFLFRNGDDDALQERLERLLDDPALGRRMAEEGRRTAMEEFTVDAFVRRTAELYAAVLEGRPLPGRLADAPRKASGNGGGDGHGHGGGGGDTEPAGAALP